MEPRLASATWVFKKREYLLASSVSHDWLEVTVEEVASGNTWRGKFEGKHVEELTRKTGNFKQFLVFTTMLESAINKSSESVTLDLLTYSDLEALRERRNATTTTTTTTNTARGGGSGEGQEQTVGPLQSSPGKRYLILTYSVEFDRIHYPLALSFAGQADSRDLRDTVCRLAAELERYKKEGKKGSALARLQKDYDVLLREKEGLEEAVESLQAQLVAVEGGTQERKELKMLQKVIRNLEEEVLQERSKHQRYVSKKTEELRALTQELGELRSSERTLRFRVKNLTNELALLRKGVRSSPSGYLRPRRTPPSYSSSSFKKTPSSAGSGGLRERQRERGSGEGKRGRAGSHEKRLALGMPKSRIRTPSPRGVGGGRWMRFDPSAYAENKRRQRKDSHERIQRLRSPSYHGSATHSRSSSLEKANYLSHQRSGSGGSSVGRPPVQLRSGSRRLWGSSTEVLRRGIRTRSSSLGSVSGRSSRDYSPASSRGGSYNHQQSLSDLEPSPPTRGRPRQTSSNKIKSKRLTGGSGRRHPSTPTSSGKSGTKNTLLDHSAEMSEIDARLNALQQFMKRSLEASKPTHSRR